MRIGILGSGNIGGTCARLFADAGHEVAISNSRGPESLTGFVDRIGHGARTVTPEEAVDFGEVVLLAIPWRLREQLPDAQRFYGKVVVDAMNPYAENFDVIDLEPSSSSEEVVEQLKGARLVKAFNTMLSSTLAGEARPDGGDDRLVLFVAGDDEEAKQVVSRLIEDVGFAAVDTGDLATGGRLQQPSSPIYAKAIRLGDAEQVLRDLP